MKTETEQKQTAMQRAIQILERQRNSLREMELLGVLLDGEFTHKSNQITTIQITLAQLLPEERKEIESAFDSARMKDEFIAGVSLGDGFEYETAEQYYETKFKQ